MTNKPRIFMGFSNTVGYCLNLKKGFDQLNIYSVFVEGTKHPFEYSSDENIPFMLKVNRWILNRKEGNTKFERSFGKIFHLLMRLPLFLWALTNFDVFIFMSYSSFFRYYDLPILKFFNKKIIYIYTGSDSRPAPISGLYAQNTDAAAIDNCVKVATQQIYHLRKVEKYADYIINHTATGHYHKRKFIRWLTIGIPFFGPRHTNENTIETRKKIRIVHAPSRPALKGSPFFRSIIEKLVQEGQNIEYIELSGLPNHEILLQLQNCDFVLDQIYSDTPMAGLVTEAAFFGKPSVVGSYYAEDLRLDNPNLTIPPSAFVHPEEIEAAIRKLVSDKEFREKLGKKAKQFVTNHWGGKVVAERFMKLIDNDVPEDWYFDPSETRYLHGWGLRDDKALNILNTIITNKGVAALHFDNTPKILDKIRTLQSGPI